MFSHDLASLLNALPNREILYVGRDDEWDIDYAKDDGDCILIGMIRPEQQENRLAYS